MGRRRRRRRRQKERRLVFLIFLSFNYFLFSQTIIKGAIKEKNSSNSIASTSVILKDSLNSSIVAYTFSDRNGIYTLTAKQAGEFKLNFSSLGYKTKVAPLTIDRKRVTPTSRGYNGYYDY